MDAGYSVYPHPSPETPPLPLPNEPGSMPISLARIRSTLFSIQFLTMMSGLVIAALLGLFASMSLQGQLVAPPGDPAIETLQQTRQQFQQTLFQIREERRRDDYHPDYPTNYGDLQAVIQARGTALKYRVDSQIGTPTHSNYAKHPDVVYQAVRQETMKLLVLAANHQSVTLSYPDPATGERFEMEVFPEDLAQFAIGKLEAISYAQDSPVQQTTDLNQVRKDIAAQEEQLKLQRALVLEASGQPSVAAELRSKDAYGLPMQGEIPYAPPGSGAPQF